jgi:hypothetical protein
MFLIKPYKLPEGHRKLTQLIRVKWVAIEFVLKTSNDQGEAERIQSTVQET